MNLPRTPDFGPLADPTPETVLEQLTIQALYFVAPQSPLQYVVESLRLFKGPRNSQDWFNLLLETCKTIPRMTILLDLRILPPYFEDVRNWPSVFENIISRSTAASKGCLKVMFLGRPLQFSRQPRGGPVVTVEDADQEWWKQPCFLSLQKPRPEPFKHVVPAPQETHMSGFTVSQSSRGNKPAFEPPLEDKEEPAVPPKSPNDIKIAIICALTLEADSIEALFDYRWEGIDKAKMKAPGDKNAYSFGMLGGHHVVLAFMPGMGKSSTTMVASYCRNSYRNVKLALVIGICGGVPFYKHQDQIQEVVLGDVIISEGLVCFDFGRVYPDQFVRKNGLLDNLARPPPEIRSFLSQLRGLLGRKTLQERTFGHLQILDQTHQELVDYPGANKDQLFEGTYSHRHHGTNACSICSHPESKPGVCDLARALSCEELLCDQGRLVRRQRIDNVVKLTRDSEPTLFPLAIHFGTIASGDQVMKSGEDRDSIAKAEGIIAFEMEAAGVWDVFPCLVIKGVCDYADSHKSKGWQRYAAATAAACAKAFLQEWSVNG
ncbi:nucleoside phosphorylase domain-containing protein [Colletotrichum cereale]|nr:nucleoside phosphorylase domain-containing protein [Colletotrichum cereale]